MYRSDPDAHRNDDVLDQVMMGLGTGGDGRGLRIRASSFQDPMSIDSWEARLDQFARLTSAGTVPAPTTAFSYLVFPDRNAALMRRTDRGNDKARNFSHTLIGPAEVLGPRALLLTGWNGWAAELPASPELPTVPVPTGDDTLDDTAVHPLADQARTLADSEPSPILSLVHVLLADPARRISVLGAPDEQALPLLWALRQILDPVFDGTEPRREWTFSTYQDHDGDRAYLPEVVFLPPDPLVQSHTSNHRIRLPAFPDKNDPLDWLARQLVERYRDDPAELTRVIRSGVGRLSDVHKRIATLARLMDSRSERHVPVSRPSAIPTDDGYGRQRRPVEVSAGRRPMAFTPDIEPLVQWLAGARNRREVTERVQHVRERAGAVEPHLRPAVRQVLFDHDFFGRKLADALWPNEQLSAFEALAEYAFGPGGMDLADRTVRRSVERLVLRPGSPSELITVLNRAVQPYDVEKAFLLALGNRWLAEHGRAPIAPEPPAGRVPPVRIRRSGSVVVGGDMRGPRVNAPLFPLLAVLAGLVMVIVVLLVF